MSDDLPTIVVSSTHPDISRELESLTSGLAVTLLMSGNEQDFEAFLVSGKVDLIILDMESPAFSDISAVRHFRLFGGGDYVPILLIGDLIDQSISLDFMDEDCLKVFRPLDITAVGAQIKFLLNVGKTRRRLIDERNKLLETQRIARVGSWEWNSETDHFFCSEEARRILCVSEAYPIDTMQDFFERIHLEDRDMFESAVQTCAEEKLSLTVEYRTVFPDGEIHFMMLQGRSVLDHSGEFKGISGVIHDVTERKKQEDQIIYLAFHDELTGLPNPKLFKDRLEDSIDLASRYDQKVATLFFDLDRFKRINDTLGHTLGDRLIRQVADRLVATLRGTDCVSRLGMTGEDVPVARMAGDEFIVLITRIREINDIAKIAKRLVEQMKIPFFLEDHEIFVTATIGISVFPEDGRNAETLLKNADSALHFAKKEGGDRFRFYEQKMNSTAMDRLSLEADLRRALENDEFLLYYQPQVDGSSGNILGVEGLIRWNHPQRGMVAPFHFIPLLEETGQIVEVGDWVLRTACLQQKVWQATVAHPLSVSVNLSVRQFMQSGFVDRVKRIVEETGANPEFLNLEITESLLLDNADSMIKLLKDFRDMGFGISIDDFGTGYSSLSYLKKLPINELKIDRSFVKDIATELDDGTIAKAIISLARNLKLQVIAEGVEEEQQLQFLLNEGCNHIQGFYFGKPVPAGELIFTPGIK